MAKRPVILLAALALALAGCGGSEPGSEPSTTTAAGTTTSATTTDAEAGMKVTAYFLRDERVAAAHRSAPASKAVARAAVEALLAGPPDPLDTAVPAGTRLLGLTIDAGVATVDLSSEFESGGGSASMLGRVAQVVYTLTQFPSVTGVAFQVEGKPVHALGGEGLVLDRPQTRKDYEEQTPPILVETPTAGDTVTSPIHVAGTSNVYEANMVLQVFQGDQKLLERVVTASSGSGERGTFAVEVPVDVTGGVRLVLYAPSGENGEPQHQVDVPVTVTG